MKDCIECKSIDICLKCTSNLFNGKCYPYCEESYYSICGHDGSNRCEKCSEGCRACENKKICNECNTDYYLSGNYCVLENNCPEGRYIDKEHRICKKCRDSFCKTCDINSCSECKNGYELIDMICSEKKRIWPVLEKPFLFDSYTQNVQDKMRSLSILNDLNGVGISSKEFAISMWIRLITPYPSDFTGSRIFEIRVPSVSGRINSLKDVYEYNLKKTFKLGLGLTKIDGEYYCHINIKTPNNDKEIKKYGPDCSFDKLMKWKFLLIQFNKYEGNFGHILLKTYNDITREMCLSLMLVHRNLITS